MGMEDGCWVLGVGIGMEGKMFELSAITIRRY
jgi:hypothetical protein